MLIVRNKRLNFKVSLLSTNFFLFFYIHAAFSLTALSAEQILFDNVSLCIHSHCAY